jgi:hypothetical protein
MTFTFDNTDYDTHPFGNIELPFLNQCRQNYHKTLLSGLFIVDANTGIVSNADKGNKSSIHIANTLHQVISRKFVSPDQYKLSGQQQGNIFEEITSAFISETFSALIHLRPGQWIVKRIQARDQLALAEFEQYNHLICLKQAADANSMLAASLGNDYVVAPDIIILRNPESEAVINGAFNLVDSTIAKKTALRMINNNLPLLHASISCKWTMRSDRSQNARSEALNLIRNRKGHLPHVVVVTGEPLPSRLASLALGTGDIDCVYHFALPELRQAIVFSGNDDHLDTLDMMVEGKRLKDIADLPFDLAV